MRSNRTVIVMRPFVNYQGKDASFVCYRMSKHEKDGEFMRKGLASFLIALFDAIKMPMAIMERLSSSFEILKLLTRDAIIEQ